MFCLLLFVNVALVFAQHEQLHECDQRIIKKKLESDTSLREAIELNVKQSLNGPLLRKTNRSHLSSSLPSLLPNPTNASMLCENVYSSERKMTFCRDPSRSGSLRVTLCPIKDSYNCKHFAIRDAVDDFMISQNGQFIYYKQGRRVMLSAINDFLTMSNRRRLLFEASLECFRFVYAQSHNYFFHSFCSTRGYRLVYFDVSSNQSCTVSLATTGEYRSFRSKMIEDDTKSEKRETEKEITRRRRTSNIRLFLATALPSIVIIAIIAGGCLFYFLCWSGSKIITKSERDLESEAALPPSLVENARRNLPAPEISDLFAPKNFEASEFQFRGPLKIERGTKFCTMHELEEAAPIEQKPDDHVGFDVDQNEAYDIGEGVEITGSCNLVTNQIVADKTQSSAQVPVESPAVSMTPNKDKADGSTKQFMGKLKNLFQNKRKSPSKNRKSIITSVPSENKRRGSVLTASESRAPSEQRNIDRTQQTVSSSSPFKKKSEEFVETRVDRTNSTRKAAGPSRREEKKNLVNDDDKKLPISRTQETLEEQK